MCTQIQIQSQDRLGLFGTTASTAAQFIVKLPQTISGRWELSYALLTNTLTQSLSWKITIDGTPPGLLTTSVVNNMFNFSIGVTSAPGAYQTYSSSGRHQIVDLGPGKDSIGVIVTDDTGTMVNFGSTEWLMVLQKIETPARS